MSKQYYLREDVYISPLVNNWYAWSYLISPLTYAMYAVKNHKRLMTSFINNYELHILANQSDLLTGGEFVDCKKEQVEEIKVLVNHIDEDLPYLAELVEALGKLNQLVQNHTNGLTIEGMYEQLPDILRGYIELNMDLYHQPSFRMIEGLLYKSKFYREDFQSVSFGVLGNDYKRPFVFSTPILPDTDNLIVQAPFNSPVWDQIFVARNEPLSKTEIDEIFAALPQTGGMAISDLFTEQAPRINHEPVTENVRLTYTGHAGLMIESVDTTVLIDPIMPSRTDSNFEDVFSYSQLPAQIDYILLTHNHSDHIQIETLLQLRHKVGKVVVPINNGGSLADPSLKLMLERLGFKVIALDDMDEIKVAGGHITALPFVGEHGDLNIRSKSAWLVNLGGKNIYAGADSSNLDPVMYKHIKQIVGKIDVLALGMECVGAPYTWCYGALTTSTVSKEIKESRRLNGSDFEKAKNMVDVFEPAQVYIYALGIEPWFKYFMGLEYNENSEQIVQSSQLVSYCGERKIPIQLLQSKMMTQL